MSIELILTILAIILGPVLTLALALAAAVVFRSTLAKTAGEIQDRVINSLQADLNAQNLKIMQLEKDNMRLTTILEIIQSALRKKEIFISIEGEMVSITDKDGSNQNARIKP